MDEETENLQAFAKILFPDSESYNLDSDQLAYLSRIRPQGLDGLNGEVSRLNEELAIIEHQTRDMSSQNYQIFVQSAQTTNQIKKSLEVGTSSIEKLTDTSFLMVKSGIQSFSDGPCEEFITKEKQVNSLFTKKGDLCKILNMPYVVRKCLAEEKLQDAIQVLQCAQEMHKNVPQPPPIVLMKTCEEVIELKSEIQDALLLKLSSGSIGLSDCLQTVSLLRNFFPDDKSLRFRFLQSRMKQVPFEQARSWIFDTLTQHRAAFGSDSNHFLSTWVTLQINRVLTDLQKQVDQGDSLDSLMMQAFYFGESLSRVGSDIRGLIIQIFTEYISKKICHELTQYEVQFLRNLHQFNLSSNSLSSATGTGSGDGDENSPNLGLDLPPPDDLTPPSQLISYGPLAFYLNQILILLNNIGKVPIIQSAPLIIQKLNGSIGKIGDEIEIWGKNEWLTWDLKEQSEFNRMKRYFEHLLVPHLDKVVRVLYPSTNLSMLTGYNVSKCAEMLQIRYVKNNLLL